MTLPNIFHAQMQTAHCCKLGIQTHVATSSIQCSTFTCSIACSCPYKFNALCWCSMLDTDTTQQGPTSLKSHHAICKCSNFWKTHSHFANVLKGAFFFTLWINHFDLVRIWVFQSTCIALHHLFCHLIEHSSPKNWSNTWIVHQYRLTILSIFLFNN